MSRQIDESHRDELKDLAESERESVYRQITWLASRDEQFDEDELGFLEDLAELLEIEPEDPEELLADVDGLDALLDGIETDWVRAMLVGQLIAMAWVNGDYDARERVGIRRACRAMGIDDESVAEAERDILEALKDAEEELEADEQENEGRFFKIVGAAVVGGGLAAATGGLAAPVVGGAIGSIMGLSGAAATSAGLAALGGGSLAAGGFGMAGGTAVVAGGLGIVGAGKAGRAISKRTKQVDDLEVIDLDNDGAPVVVGVSGFLSEDADFEDDWNVLQDWAPHADVKALRWEAKANRNVAEAVGTLAGQYGAKKGLEYFAKRAAAQAGKVLRWPMWSIQAFDIVANPWSVARDLAEKTGSVLAGALSDRIWGPRPVSLVGFSLGTRVIATALDEMSNDAVAKSVERVILMGGAVGRDHLDWSDLAQTVPGAFVNTYSRDDWVLGGLYRAAERLEEPIGLGPLDSDGVIDVDVTDQAGGHLDYRPNMPDVFERVESAIDQRQRSDGRWQSDRSVDDEVEEICESRTSGREVDL